MRQDLPAIQRLQTADFLTIQQSRAGVAIVGATQQLETLRKAGPSAPILGRELASPTVRRYGSVAVLTAVGTFRTLSDKPEMSQAVVTEVWVEEGGSWRVAHFQTTELPSKRP